MLAGGKGGNSHALRRHIRAIDARQKHTARRTLDRLARSADRRRRAKRLEALFAHRREHERRVDRAGANGIDTDALLLDDLVRQGACKGNDRALGRGVVEELGVADKGCEEVAR